jgi:riboflavin kinase/FMN adenylyltransferase
MEFIRGLHNLHQANSPCVATIGNFDGVHLGHQRILKNLSATGQHLQLPTLLITFEPTPKEFFMKDHAPARLTNLREKLFQLQGFELDQVICLSFDRRFAEIPAETFITEILHQRLSVRQLIVGDDFRFGYQRRGDFALLQKMGAVLNMGVTATSTVLVDSARVSSSAIRDALAHGELKQAHELLGRNYYFCGKVAYGAQRGRHLGFPTANIFIKRRVCPISGVFVVNVHGLNNTIYHAVANVGKRPTVDGTRILLETHILDFDQQIYGQTLKIEFLQKIREEQKFANLDALRQQINQDASFAREYFNLQNK